MSAAGFMGEASSGFGFARSAVSAYYQAAAQKGQLRSAAMDAEFASSMATINARAAEREANSILLAGQQQASLLAGRYNSAQQDFKVRTAASGIRQGGSSAEVRASMDMAKEMDLAALNANVVGQVEAARGQAVDFRNRAALSRVSAGNLRRTGGTIKPWDQVLTSLVGNSGQLAPQWQHSSNSSRGQGIGGPSSTTGRMGFTRQSSTAGGNRYW